MVLKKVKSTYFNSQNKQVSLEDGQEYEDLIYAKKLTKKFKGKKKLLQAFKWITRYKLKKTPKISLKKGYTAHYASDYLVKTKPSGNKISAASAFAYLAYALGYKKVSVVTDRKDTKKGITCLVEINGKVYDPSSKDKKKNYNVTYKKYGVLKKKYKVNIPYNKMKALKVKYSGDKGKITTYDAKLRQLYYSNGQYVTGIAVYNGQFYAFGVTELYAYD